VAHHHKLKEMAKEAVGLHMNIMAIGQCYAGCVASTEDLSLLECYAMSAGN
jgi:hypothetical protein